MNTRKQARTILETVCRRESGLSLSEYPDLPCVGEALDAMEEILEEDGESADMAELMDIAQEAVYALMDDAHLTEIVRDMPSED